MRRYLGVDYDNQYFNISPAVFPVPNTLTDIVQIHNHVPPSDNQTHSSGLSAGAIAGIAVGATAAVALIAGLIFFCIRKRRNDRLRFSTTTTMRPQSMDGTTINDGRPEMNYYEPQQDAKDQPPYEHYNKGPAEMDGEDQDQFKAEIQGSYAHREMSSPRHELYGSSVRRRSDQSRGSISPLPMDESQRGRFRHLRQESDSSFGRPSPASQTNSPPFGPNDISGHPSPPTESLTMFSGPFELPGGSRREETSTSAPTPAPNIGPQLGPEVDTTGEQTTQSQAEARTPQTEHRTEDTHTTESRAESSEQQTLAGRTD